MPRHARKRPRGCLDCTPDLGGKVLRCARVVGQRPVDLLHLGIGDLDVLLHQADTVVQVFDPRRQRAGPERLEVRAHRLHRAAEQHHVTIAKVVALVVVEVFSRHVATACDADLAVDDQRLVVHPLVDRAKVGQHIECAGQQRHADRGLGVVDADVDRRMLGQGQQGFVGRVDHQIIHQHAHAYATIGRAQQRLCREDADVIGAPDEVLHLDRVLGLLNQPGACEQGFLRVIENVDAGLSRIHGEQRIDLRHAAPCRD